MRKAESNIIKRYYSIQKKIARFLFKKAKVAHNAQSQWETAEKQDHFTPHSPPDYNKLNQIRSELTPTKKQIEEQESLNNALFVSQVLRISVSAEVNDSENLNNKPKKHR